MKTLLLLRHAKSSWDEADLPDFDRPLAERGRRDAPLMGEHIRHLGIRPDLVLCSAARRTRETADLAFGVWNDASPQVTFDASIYEASAGDLLERIRRISADRDRVLVIGHNPGMQDLIGDLTGHSFPSQFARQAQKFPTAAFAILACRIDAWSDLAPGTASLLHCATPKGLAPETIA